MKQLQLRIYINHILYDIIKTSKITVAEQLKREINDKSIPISHKLDAELLKDFEKNNGKIWSVGCQLVCR